MAAIGLDPSNFSSHSLRRGGTSYAMSLQIPGEMVQSMGDWKSDAYKQYIDWALQDRVNVAITMGQNVNSLNV